MGGVLRVLSVVAVMCVALLGAESANAASITDYTLLVLGESSGASSNDSIWGYTSLNAAPVELSPLPTPEPFYGNGLVTDAPRNRLIFIDDGDGGAGDRDALYEYDLTGTGTFTQLGNVSTPEIFISGTSGGGGWYQGEYYYWDDAGGVGSEGMIRISFNGDGSFASSTTFFDPAPGDFGDFGDLAIDEATGILYAISQDGGTAFDFWSMDLADLGSGRTILATDVDYQQLAFANDGQLVGVERTSLAARNWYLIDTSDGSSTTVSRLGDFDVYDMANGGLYPIPEPSSATLPALRGAAATLLFRTRRRA
jgi:hypothetical protein